MDRYLGLLMKVGGFKGLHDKPCTTGGEREVEEHCMHDLEDMSTFSALVCFQVLAFGSFCPWICRESDSYLHR